MRKIDRRRGLGWTAAGLAVTLAAATGVRHRAQLAFYASVARALSMGQIFRRRYPLAELDVPFCPSSGVRLDAYGLAPGEGQRPVLIFIHGGGWKDYHKEVFAPLAMRLLPRGIVAVIPDYTLYPRAGYEQMADEVAAAVDWTLRHCARLGGDPNRVVLAGHSAGGHLTGLVGLDERFLHAYGRRADALAGLVGLSGVYDIAAERAFYHARGTATPVMDTVMGGPPGFGAASPIKHVHSAAPPFLLIHGARDDIVPASISLDFHEALAAGGAHSTLKIYPEAGHSDFLLAGLDDAAAPVITDIVDFVQSAPASAACEPETTKLSPR